MQQNVGSPDRIVRILLGAVLLVDGVAGSLGFVSLVWTGMGQVLASMVVAVIGVILLITDAIGKLLDLRHPRYGHSRPAERERADGREAGLNGLAVGRKGQF